MKTQEELNTIKEEVKAINEKLNELTEEELAQVFGGILACFTAGDALTLAAVYIYYTIKNRTFCPTKQDFRNLPDFCELKSGDEISLDIGSLEDVTLASEQIMLFCKGHKTDRRTAYFVVLSFEELSSNIVKHGFPHSEAARPMIDMRAVITGNTLVVRLCDNYPHYDVTENIAAINEAGSDSLHNIGTRIVSRTASEIKYLHTFDTNCLIISFKTCVTRRFSVTTIDTLSPTVLLI